MSTLPFSSPHNQLTFIWKTYAQWLELSGTTRAKAERNFNLLKLQYMLKANKSAIFINDNTGVFFTSSFSLLIKPRVLEEMNKVIERSVRMSTTVRVNATFIGCLTFGTNAYNHSEGGPRQHCAGVSKEVGKQMQKCHQWTPQRKEKQKEKRESKRVTRSMAMEEGSRSVTTKTFKLEAS
ncbi:hypothetical protein K435DRAFT_802198 [Dendrothele bispora CBS 962.96]|uniref:Uncharacterized protein n=1 Tax=Dendrothele bispora (strain CBS 962.96) TaxID=1314807 RepID=A0A4S8LN77_DENBC|nr:hypothetical protein K435DRAFT_802198 [Dendrothele bispora CBS 962.96]